MEKRQSWNVGIRSLEGTITEQECAAWKANPLVNPITGRQIKRDGQIFKQLQLACARLKPGASSTGTRSKRDDEPVEGKFLERRRDDSKFLERRRDDVKVIKQIIDSIPSKQWDRCMTGDRASVFLSQLENVRLLGSGTFGQVYAATIKGKTFVVKEAYLDDDENERMHAGIVGNNIDKNAYPQEFKILKLVQSLLKSNLSPNFSYVYRLSACEGCFFGGNLPGSCYLTFMELADGDGKAIPPTRRDDQVSIFSQLMMALSAIQTVGIWHRDIKKQNILFKRVPAGGWYEYKVNDDIFYVENTGYLAMLADFGSAAVLAPKYGIGEYYGTRNARVVGNKLVPITIEDNDEIKWYDDKQNVIYGTDNTFTKEELDDDEIPFDLNDVKQYRPQEYFYDIQDVVRMFIGGPRTQVPGQHSPWPGLDPEFDNILHLRCYASDYVQFYTNMLYLLDAALMLRRAVPETRKPKNIIGTFEQ